MQKAWHQESCDLAGELRVSGGLRRCPRFFEGRGNRPLVVIVLALALLPDHDLEASIEAKDANRAPSDHCQSRNPVLRFHS